MPSTFKQTQKRDRPQSSAAHLDKGKKEQRVKSSAAEKSRVLSRIEDRLVVIRFSKRDRPQSSGSPVGKGNAGLEWAVFLRLTEVGDANRRAIAESKSDSRLITFQS